MNEFEENPFIADEDDIIEARNFQRSSLIEAAPFDMQIGVDDELDDCLDVTE